MPELQLVVRAIELGEEYKPLENEVYSVGVHPWLLDRYKITDVQSLPLPVGRLFGIGEFGLDRYRDENFELQVQFVQEIFGFVAHHSITKIVLHCVRAHSDLLHLIKRFNYKGAVLIHDYQGNMEQTQNWLKYNTYFSFSPRSLRKKKQLIELLSFIPPDRACVESDDFTSADFQLFLTELASTQDLNRFNFAAKSFLELDG